MQRTLKFKSRNCIEWELKGPFSSFSYYEQVSENFKINGVTCHFRFETQSLYLVSNVLLNSSVDVRVYNISASNNYCFRKTVFRGKNQEIWKHSDGYSLPGTLNLEIIILAHILRESQTGCISENFPQDGASSSFLGKDIHFQSLSQDISKLFGDTSSCDVKITCDGKTLHAHKIVLAMRSPVFSAMLKSDMAESKTGLINVADVEYSVFASFLHYIYSGMLPKLSIENAVGLYKVGDKYAVQKLKLACSEYLTNNLSESNACDMLLLADMHSDKSFREKIISYIVDQRIPQRDKGWLNFCKCHSKLANEVLNLYIKEHCPM